jgi:hypothetical protein
MTEKFNAVTITLGLLALVALVLAGALAILNHPLESVVLFLGVCSTCVGVLAPSPLSKPVVRIEQPSDQPVPVDAQPGYQPDPHKGDDAAKAQRLAHHQQVLHEGAMRGPTDTDVFRSDMHRVARRAADLDNLRPAWVPSPGVVTGGRERYGTPPGWTSKLPAD